MTYILRHWWWRFREPKAHRFIAREGFEAATRKWQDSEPHRPLLCYDCPLPYGDPGWVDVSISDEAWLKIAPWPGGGGVLCLTCMTRRLLAAGLDRVPVKISSGPFDTEAQSYWYLRGLEHGRKLAAEERRREGVGQ